MVRLTVGDSNYVNLNHMAFTLEQTTLSAFEWSPKRQIHTIQGTILAEWDAQNIGILPSHSVVLMISVVNRGGEIQGYLLVQRGFLE